MNDPYAAVLSVIGQLRERITDVQVDEMVDDIEGYALSDADCALLVQYSNSVFQGIGPGKAKRIPLIDVHIIARSIRGPQGAIGYLAQAALSGFRIPDNACGRLYPVSDRFISQITGQWQYVATFAVLGIYQYKSHLENPNLISTE